MGKHHIKCLACGAKKEDNLDVQFFKLPENEARRTLWLENLNSDLLNKKISNDYRVCEKHFSEHMLPKTTNRLKKNAYPGPPRSEDSISPKMKIQFVIQKKDFEELQKSGNLHAEMSKQGIAILNKFGDRIGTYQKKVTDIDKTDDRKLKRGVKRPAVPDVKIKTYSRPGQINSAAVQTTQPISKTPKIDPPNIIIKNVVPGESTFFSNSGVRIQPVIPNQVVQTRFTKQPAINPNNTIPVQRNVTPNIIFRSLGPQQDMQQTTNINQLLTEQGGMRNIIIRPITPTTNQLVSQPTTVIQGNNVSQMNKIFNLQIPNNQNQIVHQQNIPLGNLGTNATASVSYPLTAEQINRLCVSQTYMPTKKTVNSSAFPIGMTGPDFEHITQQMMANGMKTAVITPSGSNLIIKQVMDPPVSDQQRKSILVNSMSQPSSNILQTIPNKITISKCNSNSPPTAVKHLTSYQQKPKPDLPRITAVHSQFGQDKLQPGGIQVTKKLDISSFTCEITETNCPLYLGLSRKELVLLKLLSTHCEMPREKVLLVIRKIRLNESMQMLADLFRLSPEQALATFIESSVKIAKLFRKTMKIMPKGNRKECIVSTFNASFYKTSPKSDHPEEVSPSCSKVDMKFLISSTNCNFINFVSKGYTTSSKPEAVGRFVRFLSCVDPDRVYYSRKHMAKNFEVFLCYKNIKYSTNLTMAQKSNINKILEGLRCFKITSSSQTAILPEIMAIYNDIVLIACYLFNFLFFLLE